MFALGVNTNWQAGAVVEKAYTISGKDAPSFADTGDFERTNAFSYAAWVRVKGDETGALFARMADPDAGYRGWDCWLEGGKPTIHLVHDWPKNAIKVSVKNMLPKERWNLVCVTYDGSSLAKGVNIYVNGERQETTILNDNLTESTRTTVPFKLGQRNSGSGVEKAGLQDVKIFTRELKSGEVASLMTPHWQWLRINRNGRQMKRKNYLRTGSIIMMASIGNCSRRGTG
ncbi:MAG: LamG-like jellyroll fold domain-containing protein [Limisphaerales bacterium]